MESLDGVVAESKTQSDHWDHPMLYLEPTEVNLPLLSEERSVVFGRTSAFSLKAQSQSGIRQTSFASLRSQGWLDANRWVPYLFSMSQWIGRERRVLICWS